MLEADYLTSPGIWAPGWILLSDMSLPISTEVTDALESWLGVYADDYYLHDEHWSSPRVCTAWHRQGWELFVELNRQLDRYGYVVLPAFPTGGAPLVSLDRRRRFAAETDVADEDDVGLVRELVQRLTTPSPADREEFLTSLVADCR